MPYGEIHCMRVRKREKENIKKLKVTKGTSPKISQHDDTEHKPKHKRIGTISALVGLSLIGGTLLVSPIGTAFADTVSDTIRSAQLEIEHEKEEKALSEKAKATPVLTQDEVTEDEAQAEQERKIEEYTQLLLSKQYAETANAVADDVVEKANEEDEQRKRQQEQDEMLTRAEQLAHEANAKADDAMSDEAERTKQLERQAEERQKAEEETARKAREEAERKLQEERERQIQEALKAKAEWMSKEQSKADAREERLAEEARIRSEKRYSTLEIEGTYVRYQHMPDIKVAPENGAASWKDDGSVDDGEGTYFVGHNPGDFSCVMSLKKGDRITVWAPDGKAMTYHVSDVFDVPRTSKYKDIKDRAMNHGECVALQTCNGDSLYRVVVALPAETDEQ